MFMNLHTIPAGKSMYTVYVSIQPEGTPRDECEADEVDVIASSRANWNQVVNDGEVHPRGERCVDFLLDMYGPESVVVGVVNQSDAFVLYDSWSNPDNQF